MTFAWVGAEKAEAVFLTLHDGDRYHIETGPLICGANQWTGFYMIKASIMKGLNGLRLTEKLMPWDDFLNLTEGLPVHP